MKFARYLEETQTPEWKRAYIDYRGLKKRITAIRREQEGLTGHGGNMSSSGEDPLLARDPSQANDNSDSAASPPPTMVASGSRGEDGGSASDADSEGYEQDFEEATAEVDKKEQGERRSRNSLNIQPLGGTAQNIEDDLATSLHEVASPVSIMSTNTSPMPGRARAGTVVTFASVRNDDAVSGHSSAIETSPQPPTISGQSQSRPTHGRTNTLASLAGNLRRSSLLLVPRLSSIGRSKTTLDVPATVPTSFNGVNPNMQPAGNVRPLNEVLITLTATQKRFFEKLDAELEKIENFYLDRERDARARSAALKDQLQGLKDHRRLFYEAHPTSSGPWIEALTSILPSYEVDKAQAHLKSGIREAAQHIPRNETKAGGRSRSTSLVRFFGAGKDYDRNARARSRKRADSVGHATSTSREPSRPRLPRLLENGGSGLKGKGKEREKYDPDEYAHAKKKLKKAVLEHYRGLEVLNDYRILNITGFRKALKKLEKVSKIQAQTAYMRERVEPSAFASGDTVSYLLKEMEELFAARFARGDKKKAMVRLRGGWRTSKSHHFSTFRSGALLGLAIPAFVDGVIKSFQPDTRAAIPQWGGLLYVYAILFVPTVFACLVGLNLLVWANTRINYVFIFELDIRTRMDHREYIELPAFFLAALMYCFYFSFDRVGEHSIHPTTWPLLWMLLVAVVMVNPLPILARSGRYWLLRNFGRLLTSGTRRVEFADFWMGDQFCSLIFTMSNVYFLGCVYTNAPGGDIGTESMDPNGDDDYDKPRFGFTHWKHCTTSKPGSGVWVVPITLAMLPLLIRFVQSVKRWVDSKLVTHLINGGKYGAGIVYYAMYYAWRHHGGGHANVWFVLWVLMGCVYTAYASTWDYLMDWSVLKPHAKHPLLRDELLYSNHIWVYYVSMVTNILIRCAWVMYIPQRGPNFLLRSFIAGTLEMLRRVQWNFIRVENEHLGNVDQYRITREVPLPYSMEDLVRESEGDEDADDVASKRSWRSRRRAMSLSHKREDQNQDA